MQKNLKIISSRGRSVASDLIANSANNSFYLAAQSLLRRKACVKRAELVLNRIAGGDWLTLLCFYALRAPVILSDRPMSSMVVFR